MFINVFVISIADELKMYEDCNLTLLASYNSKTWTWGLECTQATFYKDDDSELSISTVAINKALASVNEGLEEINYLVFMELASAALEGTLEYSGTVLV